MALILESPSEGTGTQQRSSLGWGLLWAPRGGRALRTPASCLSSAAACQEGLQYVPVTSVSQFLSMCTTKVGLDPQRIFLLWYLQVSTYRGEGWVVSAQVIEGYAGVQVCCRRGWAWDRAEEEKLENPYKDSWASISTTNSAIENTTFGVLFPNNLHFLKKILERKQKI